MFRLEDIESISDIPNFDLLQLGIENNCIRLLYPDEHGQLRLLLINFACVTGLNAPIDQNECIRIQSILGPDTGFNTYNVIWNTLYEIGEQDQQSLGTLAIMQFFDNLVDRCRELLIESNDERITQAHINSLNHNIHNFIQLGEDILDGCNIPIMLERPEIPNIYGNVGVDKRCKIFCKNGFSTINPFIQVQDYANETVSFDGHEISVVGRSWVSNVATIPLIRIVGDSLILDQRLSEIWLLVPGNLL